MSNVRFQRRIKILPGVTANLSKSGISLSIGPRGLKYNVGPRGQYLTTGLPGTGIYRRKKIGGAPWDREATEEETQEDAFNPVQDVTGLLSAPGVKRFQAGCEAYFAGGYATALEAFTNPDPDYEPDFRLMAGLCRYLSDDPQAAADALKASLETDGDPLPGTDESLVRRVIHPAVRFQAPLTRFTVAPLPYNLALAEFLLVELTQEYGELDNAIELAEQFQAGLAGDLLRLMHLSLAELYTLTGDHAKLKALFEEEVGAVENEDNIAVELMLYWASALAQQEHYEAAKQVYIRALRKTKDRDPTLLKVVAYARAEMFEQWGKTRDALTYFEKLYATDPAFADVSERIEALREA
jgi:tetratricopeptide (TPR) repeat protein